MNVKIEYKESDKRMFIYDFEVFSNFEIDHVGTMISCRNGKGDVWGHLWGKKYKKDLEAELLGLAESNPNVDEDDLWELYYYDKVRDKYNPVCNKTDDGMSYYSGCHFSDRGAEREEHKLKIGEEEIIDMIIEKFKKKLKLSKSSKYND